MATFGTANITDTMNNKIEQLFNDYHDGTKSETDSILVSLKNTFEEQGFFKHPMKTIKGSNFDFGSNGDGTADIYETMAIQDKYDMEANRYGPIDEGFPLVVKSGNVNRNLPQFGLPELMRVGYRHQFQAILNLSFNDDQDFAFSDVAYFGIGGVGHHSNIDEFSTLEGMFLIQINKRTLIIDKVLYIGDEDPDDYATDADTAWTGSPPGGYTRFDLSPTVQANNVLPLTFIVDNIYSFDDAGGTKANHKLSGATFDPTSLVGFKTFRLLVAGKEVAKVLTTSANKRADSLAYTLACKPNNLNELEQSTNPVRVLQMSFRRFNFGMGKQA